MLLGTKFRIVFGTMAIYIFCFYSASLPGLVDLVDFVFFLVTFSCTKWIQRIITTPLVLFQNMRNCNGMFEVADIHHQLKNQKKKKKKEKISFIFVLQATRFSTMHCCTLKIMVKNAVHFYPAFILYLIHERVSDGIFMLFTFWLYIIVVES